MSISRGPRTGLHSENPASSGYALKKTNPQLPSGYYWIQSNLMPNPLQMYVDMTIEDGGYDYYVIDSGIVADRVNVVGSGGGVNSGTALGLDIIYPRSSAHWLSIVTFCESVLVQDVNGFFASNPGAVYRSTGGGSYVNQIMRDPTYYGTGVADWRVPDGGRWWLRDTIYTEPNGDYAIYGFLGNKGIPRAYTLNTDMLFNDLNNYTQTTGTKYLVSTNAKP